MIAKALARAQQGGWLAVIGVMLALVLGGGGSPAPLAELALQLAIAALALAWWLAPTRPPLASIPGPAAAVAVLLIGLPLVQLIPVPPGLWHALPGRGLARDSLALIGRDGQWMPLSLAPDRTLASLLAILPPVLVLGMTVELGRKERTRIVLALAMGMGLTLLLGAAQLSGGPFSPLRFYGAGSGSLVGFQANRNSTADVLLIGIVAGMTVIRELALAGRLPDRPMPILGLAGAILVLGGLGVALTTSRAGIALLLIVLPASAILLKRWIAVTWLRACVGLAGLASVVIAALWTVARSEALVRVADRFTFGNELRPELWRDSLFAARQNFPFGVGMGNFVPALVANERLEVVRETMPNRAHNELLELAVEGGALGLGLAIALIAIVILAAHRARRAAPVGSPGLAMFATAALLILGLHSLVDYPFRSMALAMVAAACTGMLMPQRAVPVMPGSSDRLKEHA